MKKIKIICYGAGNCFDEFFKKVDREKVEIIALADKNIESARAKAKIWGGGAILPRDVKKYDFDYVVICNYSCAAEIMDYLLELGVANSKICCAGTIPANISLDMGIWEISRLFFKQTAKNNEIISELILKTHSVNNYFIVRDLQQLGRTRRLKSFNEKSTDDYVRISTLELLLDMVVKNNVLGNLAEVGVFQGYFASLINEMLPSRKLYLFDTFESFAAKDMEFNARNNILDANQTLAINGALSRFKNTSADLVMSKMPYPQMCVVKKGYFPETAADIGISEKFAFVSLDVDLYKPTYEGLEFFYPKMYQGGYIMVHDYTEFDCGGVRKAVDKFCAEHKVTPVPVSDTCGSAIIAKN